MTVRPRTPIDLALAPVAVEIDMNLAQLRDLPFDEIGYRLDLALDRPESSGSVDERCERMIASAVRNVDLHGWEPCITADHARLRLSGGSASLDIGLSAEVTRYIDAGV